MSENWKEETGALRKVFGFDSYKVGVDFTLKVAEAADAADHHPDILLTYRKVAVTTTSHDAGNSVTDRDRRLAQTIDGIYRGVAPTPHTTKPSVAPPL